MSNAIITSDVLQCDIIFIDLNNTYTFTFSDDTNIFSVFSRGIESKYFKENFRCCGYAWGMPMFEKLDLIKDAMEWLEGYVISERLKGN